MNGQGHWYFSKNRIASYVLRATMVMLMVLTHQEGDRFWFVASLLMFFFSFFPFFLKRAYDIDLPWQLDLMMVAAIIFHYAGEIFDGYATFQHYDVLAHVIASVYVSFFGFVIIVILNDHWDDFNMSAYAMAFVVALFTVAVGVIWEFQEWLSDYFFNSDLQYGANDTIKDLFVDMMTGIAVSLICVWLVKRGKLKGITGKFGGQVYRNILAKVGLSGILFVSILGLLSQGAGLPAL